MVYRAELHLFGLHPRKYRGPLLFFLNRLSVMTSHKPLPNNDLENGYGYFDVRLRDLDRLEERWASKAEQGWNRLIEAKVDMRQAPGQPQAATCSMTKEQVDFFMHGSTTGFKYIAKKYGLTPVQMWNEVEAGLTAMGMHHDDLEDVQSLIFGWKALTTEMLERYRWRYPDRCPLLDVLCTLDDTCPELIEVSDWMLELKGAKNRRRLDLWPELATAPRPKAKAGPSYGSD